VRHVERDGKEIIASRLRIALRLHDSGIAMQRQSLRRRLACSSEFEIELSLQRWLHDPRGWEAPPLRRRQPR